MLRYLVLGLLYFYAIANVNESLLKLGLYVAVPLSFSLSFFCRKDNVFNNIYVVSFCLLLSWIAFTWLTAENSGIATAQMQRLLGVFMMTIAVCNMATDVRNTPFLYGLYVFVFFTAVYYAYTHILTLQFNIASDRLNDERLNANVLANYTFYATFAIYVLGQILSNNSMQRLFKLLFLLTIPISFIIALLTASRQVLLIQVPLISTLLYVRYLMASTFKTKFIFIVGVIVCAIALSSTVTEMYDDSYLKVRSEKSITDDGRFKVLKEAIAIGCENPIVGVGPGNFILHSSKHIFSHCSYTEVFANNGVIGLLIYLFLIWYFIRNQYLCFKESRNKNVLAFLIFGVLFAVYNFLYVFYSDIWLMSFFIFVALDSTKIENEDNELNGECDLNETIDVK